ncbi:hypothetical protein [Actinomyces sp. MRS3W]|uniref:hypothetical protein n=1 Tax=Actinomyces sp. MRS3W TaxID=2800796 RepID=UPI0028FD4812|nr:hypothetical protein [Actinomyces sp. MRS3W]MDU0348178.1 hypothetical protein [Actinomyces sp. MRS3W]
MRTRKVVGPVISLIVFVALDLYAGYRFTHQLNPFSAVTWTLAIALALSMVAIAASEILLDAVHRRNALLAGVVILLVALGFAAGALYTLQTTLHTPNVLSSYWQEVTAPAVVCGIVAVGLVVRAAVIMHGPARTAALPAAAPAR